MDTALPVVTRMAPSPTGRLHIGTARTALFNYLFARHHGGSVIYRSEDTDRARSTREFEQDIVDGLHWLGLSWDSFSRQSERSERYAQLLARIVTEGKAYVSKEPAKDDAARMVEVVRLKNPGRSVTFRDEIRGDITFDTAELGDFVIARSLTDALYHFAVVVDDFDGAVTHVIRGDDHISNTPRHILIQEAIGAPRPIYAHLPLILDERRAKMSKRSGQAVAIDDYRNEGFLPEGLVNYLALLGWNPGGEREDFSLAELVEVFSLEGIQKSGAVWSREKLLSVNQRWLRKLSDQDFLQQLNTLHFDADWNAGLLKKVLPLLKERAHTFAEAKELLEGELRCITSKPALEQAVLLAKEPTDRSGLTREAIAAAQAALDTLPEQPTADEAKAAIMPLADAEEAKGKGGRGAVLWPLRYALSGQERSPDPFTLISILGKKESLERIASAQSSFGAKQ